MKASLFAALLVGIIFGVYFELFTDGAADGLSIFFGATVGVVAFIFMERRQ